MEKNTIIVFSYFGSKSKIVNLYPAPKYDRIIEPFAGSARYSLKYWDNAAIWLFDINPQVIAVWHYLQQASEQEVLTLPVLKIGDHIDDFKQLSDPEKWLIGFELCRGKAIPRKVVNRFSNWEAARQRIASNLYKIRDWHISLLDYQQIDNQWLMNNMSCTWFIDPPYILDKATGMSYKYNHIDYESLAKWIKERKGQTIVCAGTNDEWLPFERLRAVWNGGKIGEEKIYLQDN